MPFAARGNQLRSLCCRTRTESDFKPPPIKEQPRNDNNIPGIISFKAWTLSLSLSLSGCRDDVYADADADSDVDVDALPQRNHWAVRSSQSGNVGNLAQCQLWPLCDTFGIGIAGVAIVIAILVGIVVLVAVAWLLLSGSFGF